MPYITSVERIGIEKGMQQGMQLGMQQGMQLGKQQGMQLGKQQGMQLGKQQGMQLGMQQGKQLGKLEGEAIALQRVLTKRFGGLPAEITRRITEASQEQIENWLDLVFEAPSLDSVFADKDSVTH